GSGAGAGRSATRTEPPRPVADGTPRRAAGLQGCRAGEPAAASRAAAGSGLPATGQADRSHRQHGSAEACGWRRSLSKESIIPSTVENDPYVRAATSPSAGRFRRPDRGRPGRRPRRPPLRHPYRWLDAQGVLHHDRASPRPSPRVRAPGAHRRLRRRTEATVRESDGTLRFAASFETFGEKCTLKWLRHHGKPYLDIDRAAPPPVEVVADWIRQHKIKVLNVAGNAEPK